MRVSTVGMKLGAYKALAETGDHWKVTFTPKNGWWYMDAKRPGLCDGGLSIKGAKLVEVQ